MMEMDVLPELLSILEKNYQSETAFPIVWVISGLLEGDDDLTQYCLDLNVIQYLKTLLNQTEENGIIKIILLCFSNIAGGNQSQVSVNSLVIDNL